jgi:hypothetical protein
MSIEPPAPTLETLKGLWTRSLIAWPDGRRDTSTQVRWLQGPGFYADLRQPDVVPDFSGVRRLADVTDTQLSWMATQEAFAGELHFDGDCFEWQREIDLHPRTSHLDRGHLRFERGVLIERGEGDAYIEHWHRTPLDSPAAAARLHDSTDGSTGFLIRVGVAFMYARGRPQSASTTVSLPRAAGAGVWLSPSTSALPALAAEISAPSASEYGVTGLTVAQQIRSATSAEAARRLLDFEISFGRITQDSWRIDRSSLPFRSGQSLAIEATTRSTLRVADSHFEEGTRPRDWRIVALRGPADGAFALISAFSA